MENHQIEEKLYRMAVDFLKKRFPTGWGGVGVVHTRQGSDFISTALECANASVVLCIETGAMCQAHTYNEEVTHCLCVARDDENSPIQVLSPCGVCQERLRYWGSQVRVGVTTQDNSLKFVPLGELQPFHWTGAYPAGELEGYVDLGLALKNFANGIGE